MVAPIRVLVVDDSALIRQLLTTILNQDPQIEVVGTAPDAIKARERIKKLRPDVLTLDIEMPKMNGIEFLQKIMKLRPMPVVMVSSLTQRGADITLKALELGAIDFVAKPQSDLQRGLNEKAHEIVEKVKMAAGATVHPLDMGTEEDTVAFPNEGYVRSGSKKMIVIGASTGGVEALRVVLTQLPSDMPPIFIVQHMPKLFTGAFARRLDSMSALNVHEAEEGMIAQEGNVYIAPGDSHLRVGWENQQLVCHLEHSTAVGGHIPSVEVLFESVLNIAPADTIGVMLSGMGKDGADAMLALKKRGAYTIGQNKKSCVVYGMPRMAFDIGAIEHVCDLSKIPQALIDVCAVK
jgi:two-component system, chemotaxis family, protein-glutamate methylesterase/glutaminase